jgi:hypothetical protein
MASSRGRISLLAIGTIFLVVFGAMHLGVQYASGELETYEEPTALETALRAAVWDAVNERRAARGLDPAQRDAATRAGAQEAARQLVTTEYFAEPTAVGIRSGANQSLPTMGFCYLTPAKLTTEAPLVTGATASGGSEPGADGAATGAVAERVVALLASDDGGDVFSRSNEHKHGIGVAVDGRVVYVVYRTCNLGY